MRSCPIWALIIVIESPASSAPDCTKASIGDEASLLQTSTWVNTVTSERKKLSPEKKELSKVIPKALEETGPEELFEKNKLPNDQTGKASVPAIDFASGSNVVSEQLAAPRAAPSKAGIGGFIAGNSTLFLQLVFGIVFYYIFVDKRAKLYEGVGEHNMPIKAGGIRAGFSNPEKAKELYNGGVFGCLDGGVFGWVFCCRCLDGGFWNLFYGICCPGPLGGRTLHLTDTMHYWPACILIACCPCITVCAVHSCSMIEFKLSGKYMWPSCCPEDEEFRKKKEAANEHSGDRCCRTLYHFVLSLFCSCCVIAHDAAMLDQMSGMGTSLCGPYDLEKSDD